MQLSQRDQQHKIFAAMRRGFAAVFLSAILAVPVAVSHAETATVQKPVDWAASPVRLLMVERDGCVYCMAWNREIGPGYDKTTEGRRAPLLRVDIDGPWPDGLVLSRRPTITPTFILLENGQEVSRLEGYPGSEFFYPLIERMLLQKNVNGSHEDAS